MAPLDPIKGSQDLKEWSITPALLFARNEVREEARGHGCEVEAQMKAVELRIVGFIASLSAYRL